MLSRRHFSGWSAAGLVAPWTAAASAHAVDKLTRIVVPFPAGGGTDALARLLAERLRVAHYAPTVIVENRVGGGGRVGVHSVKGAPADGSVMLFAPDFPLTVYPHIYRKMSYTPRDFTPVAVCGMASMVLAAGPALPAEVRTVADFLRWCKANPKLAAYASPSAGSTAHFAGMMLSRAAGVELLHVPYKGGALAVQDLIGGQVPAAVVPLGEVQAYAAAGRARVMATTGAVRSQALPEAPTLVESGFKDLVVQSWVGMLLPTGASDIIVSRLHDNLLAALKAPEVVEAMAKVGYETPAPAAPANFAELIRHDHERWAAVVKATGFSAEE